MLLLLTACGYPSYYPDASRYTLDTGPDMLCGEELGVDAVELQVTSRAGTLLLSEVTADCAEVALGSLPPDEPVGIDTHAGAVFLARNLDGSLRTFTQIPVGELVVTWEVY